MVPDTSAAVIIVRLVTPLVRETLGSLSLGFDAHMPSQQMLDCLADFGPCLLYTSDAADE